MSRTYFIEIKKVNPHIEVYEASFVRAEPETGVAGPLNLTTRDMTPEGAGRLMLDFFEALEVEGKIVFESRDEHQLGGRKPQPETMPIMSDSELLKEYIVRYDPNRRANEGYTCTCDDFKYRRDEEDEDGSTSLYGERGFCKHIDRARARGLGIDSIYRQTQTISFS